MHPPRYGICSSQPLLELRLRGTLGNGLNSTLTGWLQKPLLLHTEAQSSRPDIEVSTISCPPGSVLAPGCGLPKSNGRSPGKCKHTDSTP